MPHTWVVERTYSRADVFIALAGLLVIVFMSVVLVIGVVRNGFTVDLVLYLYLMQLQWIHAFNGCRLVHWYLVESRKPGQRFSPGDLVKAARQEDTQFELARIIRRPLDGSRADGDRTGVRFRALPYAWTVAFVKSSECVVLVEAGIREVSPLEHLADAAQ